MAEVSALVRRQVQFREEQFSELARLARQRGLSQSELVRQAVDEWLSKERSCPRAELVARARSVIGKYHSGIPDLAVNHDKYLEEAYADESIR